ncbi:MAG: DUF4339 domain-containing protein [Bdellovibrionales bacterium]|nr:DUF4339 domain-containing protein [Bdellovibrionales bacterium]
MKYLVSHQGEQTGPFTLEEIVAQVRGKQLELFDYIYDEQKDDWILLLEFQPLAAKLKNNKPNRPPTVGTGTTKTTAPTEEVVEVRLNVSAQNVSAESVSAESISPPPTSAHAVTEWFVLKGENRFGPFAFKDVVKMLQQKVVFPFDFIWHAGMQTWQRVAEIAEFSPASIRALYGKADGKDAFVQRRFQRQQYSGRVIIHDNMSLWKGQGTEISRGGVGITMANSMVLPGQQVNVHFNSQDGWPAFNAICEVVSKKFVNDNTPVEYGLRFLSLSQEVQDELYKKVA